MSRGGSLFLFLLNFLLSFFSAVAVVGAVDAVVDGSGGGGAVAALSSAARNTNGIAINKIELNLHLFSLSFFTSSGRSSSSSVKLRKKF